MQHEALLEGGAEGTVQPVLEVVLAAPPHDVGEQVAEERRVLVEQRREVQGVLGRDELVEPELLRGQRGPLPRREAVVGVGASGADPLEDHPPRIGTTEPAPSAATPYACPVPGSHGRLGCSA